MNDNRRMATICTKEQLASLLNGREIGSEITSDESADAKAAGLVVVFGASDDLMEFRGAIHDEVGCYEGTTLYVDRRGKFFKRKQTAHKIEALWCAEDGGPAWTYGTNIPHVSFEIVEDGDVYCRGFVFSFQDLERTKDAPPAASVRQVGRGDADDAGSDRMLDDRRTLASLPPIVHFYGVWPGDRAGHFRRDRNGAIQRGRDDIDGRGPLGLYPWDVWHGPSEPQTEGNFWHWHHPSEPMTLLLSWDRSADRRGGCCATFIIHAHVSPGHGLALARDDYQKVFARIEAHLGCPVVLAGPVPGVISG